ncbi:MAG: hypothetical protein ACKVOB_11675 [Sphingomonas sp.]
MTTNTVDAIRARLAATVGGEGMLATFFNNRTMRCTRTRAAHELDGGAQTAAATLVRIADALAREQLTDYAAGADERFLSAYVRAWSAYQHAGSKCANWMVTGPSNFPVARNQKRLDAEQRRWQVLDEIAKQAPARAVKRARLARLASVGRGGIVEGELEAARAKLAGRERDQERMKATNALIRKHRLTTNQESAEKLAEVTKGTTHALDVRTALMVLTPPWTNGPIGFMPYQMSNNLAEIKRLRDRVATLERKATAITQAEATDASPPTTTRAGVEIVENIADDRLQLHFPGKPQPATIAALKSRGFKWSPRAGAWQRQLTNNARAAVDYIMQTVERDAVPA